MKAIEIRNLTDAELAKKLADLKSELFNLRFSHVTGSLSNPLTLSICKKQIALVKTVIRERELGISKAPVAVAKKSTAKVEEKAEKTTEKVSEKKTTKPAAKKVETKQVKKEKIVVWG